MITEVEQEEVAVASITETAAVEEEENTNVTENVATSTPAAVVTASA